MAVVTFSLKDFAANGISKDSLVDAIPRIGMEVEALSGEEIAIDITPNRPDLLDFTGLVRALKLFSGKTAPKDKEYVLQHEPEIEITVTKNVAKIRPYIAGLAAKGIDLSGERLKYLINFTEKLGDTYGRRRAKFSMGVYDLDSIKGRLTYDASADGRFVPLGLSGEMSFSEIVERHPKGVAYGGAISRDRARRAMMPFLSDGEKILALIPITNSESTKATTETRNIFIDITGTSRNTVMQVANLIACSMVDSGADVYPCRIKYRDAEVVSPELAPREIKIRGIRISKTLGVSIDGNQAISLANRAGYFSAKYGDSILVYVPPYRLDVLNDQDVIEDLAISYGYENISPVPVVGFSDGLAEDLREFTDSAALHMLGIGFSEALNTYLTNERVNFDNMLRPYRKDDVVGIAYSKTENITMLRTSILPGLLKSLGYSAHERMPQRLFESGSVFRMDKSRLIESSHLAFVSEHSKAYFSEAKGAVISMLGHLGIENYEIKAFSDPAFIEGRCAQVIAQGKQVAVFGELHPAVLSNFGLEEPVISAEITLIDKIEYNI